jgi:hypothetical protein
MRTFCLGLALVFLLCGLLSADDPVFSGPQVGEKLPAFAFRGVYGDEAGKPIDVVGKAEGKPVVLAFVHETTRPALGLVRVVMNYAASRQKDGLHAGVVFLTDDATATEKWMLIPSVRQNALPQEIALGLYPEGKEGPGSYGLNRNVSLTVLVAKDNRVTANFALVQPSVQADGPKILKAVVDALGGGEVPTLEELGVRADARQRPQKTNPSSEALDGKLRELIGPPYAAEHADFAKELGVRAQRIVDSPNFEQYGQTQEARDALKAWAKKFAPTPEKP